MTKVTKEMINAAHDVTMKSKLMLGHELLEKIYLAMDSQRTWVGLTDEMVLAGARALAKRHADSCGLDFDDVWKYYAEEHKIDAKAVIEAAHGIKGEE